MTPARILLALAPAALLAALVMLALAALHSPALIRHYPVLLALNIGGIALLSGVMVYGAWRLALHLRARRPGARLTLRMLAAFGALALAPLVVVYFFSVQFVNRGIDSWFDVRIEEALNKASLLRRNTLEALRRDLVEQAAADAAALAQTPLSPDAATVRLLDDLRRAGDYEELAVFTPGGDVVAASGARGGALIPVAPASAVLATLGGGGRGHAELEPGDDGGLQWRVAVTVNQALEASPAAALYVLQAVKVLPLRYATLGASIQTALAEYERLVFLRRPLKFSFVVTLTVITLMTVLLAAWLALMFARRLAAPLGQLATGQRAVAKGDYRTRLTVTSGDDLGALVQSFNEMTGQLRQAQNQAEQSRRESEMQRTYLETVMAHLSSAVLVLDRDFNVHTYNKAARAILHLGPTCQGRALSALVADEPHLAPLAGAITAPGREAEWQSEVALAGGGGRRVLICRCTRLPPESGLPGGYVAVLDDVTDLIRSQRDAAWGEVARRLAHEIKNPLTPIRLSAERMRQKFLPQLEEPERGAMDRATRTIVQQVESMKHMVDAFSGYAQPMRMQTAPVDLNQLIRDVMALHEPPAGKIKTALELAADLPRPEVDPGRMRQVFNNLMINALDALGGRDRAAVTVRTGVVRRGGAEYVEALVHDNGPGFPAEILDRLFEPYVTTKDKGTGLGLAIVKRIVEEHDGVLTAENPPAGGALLRILLPLR